MKIKVTRIMRGTERPVHNFEIETNLITAYFPNPYGFDETLIMLKPFGNNPISVLETIEELESKINGTFKPTHYVIMRTYSNGIKEHGIYNLDQKLEAEKECQEQNKFGRFNYWIEPRILKVSYEN
ncbi:hypothetical protein [Spiroplasma sp. SV19]|uniref:hypothetical protein n=1 Tax=Spiroplasma sp. SV19 TaxID=2570468 RepID=UPI0024B6B409|nr:hypothetical protein [Spiroplasma sp. SV19]WHQ36781.1 hypothetical protein E7Y35_02600 [Spiroplasma sp. SV19]WHQ37179.1 hypothetical protein E7Y35_04725 [Spiroplasma sp. SV19]